MAEHLDCRPNSVSRALASEEMLDQSGKPVLGICELFHHVVATGQLGRRRGSTSRPLGVQLYDRVEQGSRFLLGQLQHLLGREDD